MHIKSFGWGCVTGMVVATVIHFSLLYFVIHHTARSAAASRIPDASFAKCPKDGDSEITSILEPIRRKHKVAAIGAAIVTSKGLRALGVVGVRRIDTEIPVTVQDMWHLGSDTKAMTASLAGRLVERGVLQWDSSLATIFPDLAPSMNPDMKHVTLIQLLSHHAGLPGDLNWGAMSKKGTVQEQRYAVVKKTCADQPQHKPGSRFSYSNLGYVIVGAIIERMTTNSWEQKITEEIFNPLEMTSVGFGGTGTPGKIDQPWGHNADGTPVATNGPAMDNPLLVAPAGCVYCSITDWSKFIIDQLRGARGKPGLLKPETYKTLQTPPFGGDYALGWIAVQRDWGNGTVFNHGGCNTMNYANVWIAPRRDFAILVCVNQGGDEAFNATDEAISPIMKSFVEQE